MTKLLDMYEVNQSSPRASSHIIKSMPHIPLHYPAYLMVVVHHLQVEGVPLTTALVVVLPEEVPLLEKLIFFDDRGH